MVGECILNLLQDVYKSFPCLYNCDYSPQFSGDSVRPPLLADLYFRPSPLQLSATSVNARLLKVYRVLSLGALFYTRSTLETLPAVCFELSKLKIFETDISDLIQTECTVCALYCGS